MRRSVIVLGCVYRGLHLGTRNLKYRGGAGGDVPVSAGGNAARVPPGWNGPYVQETTNSRPVPSAF